MEQKIKFILGGLIIAVVVVMFLFLQSFNAAQAIKRDRDELKTENSALSSKISELENRVRERENKNTYLQSQLEKIAQDLVDLQKRYDLTNKTREELVEKLKAQQAPQVSGSLMLPSSGTKSTDAYWAEVIKAKTDLEMQLVNLRNELKSMQASNGQLQKEKGNLELDINNLRRDKEDLQRQLEYNQKLMDSIAQELVREKNDKTKIESSSKSLNNDNALLTRQLKSLTSRKINLEEKMRQLVEERESLQARLSKTETTLEGKVSGVDFLKSQVDTAGKKDAVELAPIVVRPKGGAGENITTFTGRILTVDRENNFVIIDLGEGSGIKTGDTFAVYRDSQKVAAIEVIKVSKSVSACDIRKENTPIKIGDVVR